jgi:ADP-ribose pyrophosphatase YjhB (NUDIX family)
MPVKSSYCAHCGQPVTVKDVQGRPRAVCPACATIFYENPLPVAAAVVLSPRRETLLVKRRRPPHAGMWCLPMGFAELDETIADAALRELKEETGIDGQILRLLDADSLATEHYGDLLIVTFEIQNIAGREQPGDDAEDVRYFPLGHHPPLAFSSNEKALRTCAALHQEGWQMQDSFIALQREEGQALLSDELVALVQERAAAVAQAWLTEIRLNPTTQAYLRLPDNQLLEEAGRTLSKLAQWLKGDEATEEVRQHYRALGRERRTQGFMLHEVLSALMLLKKLVWATARHLGMYDRPIDMYRLLELNRRTAVFFDKAMYHAARGFDAET